MLLKATNQLIRNALGGVLLWSVCESALAAEKVTFEAHVKPILRQHCAGCHNQDDAASDFAADSYDATLAGGAGGDVVAAGDADGSRLWRLVNHDEEPVMPPGGDKLPEEQLRVLRAWIEGGLLRDANSKPAARKTPAVAAVAPSDLGKPIGEPAMPRGVFRQPVVTAASVGPIDALATSRWAPLVAVPWQRQVSLYHSEKRWLLGVLPYLEGVPRVVRFSRDGSLLLVAGGREASLGTAALFDVATGARLVTVGDEVDTVLAADLSPDNALIAIGGPKKKVRVYRVADGSLAYTCAKHTDWITAVQFSPDGELLATADRSAGLRLWQAQAGHERGDLRGHKAAIPSLSWRGDGGLLASASEDGTARLWSPEGAAVKSWNAHDGGALSIDFASDGRLVTAGRDRRVKLWKPDGGLLGELARTPDVALAAAFTHDAKSVVVSDWLGKVRVVSIEGEEVLGRLIANPLSLEDRLASAEQRLSEADDRLAESRRKVESASGELESGRERHAEYAARVANAELAMTDSSDRVANAESAAEQRGRASRAVAVAYKEVEATLIALQEQLAETVENEDETDALVAQVESAKRSRDATSAAAAAAEELMEQAGTALVANREALDQSERLVAQISNQRAGLPDLAGLEQNVHASEQAVAKREQAYQKASKALGSAEKELERFQSAADTLASQHEQSAERLDLLRSEAGAASAKRDEASQKKERANDELARLRAELKGLRAKIVEQRAQVEAAADPLKDLNGVVVDRQAKLANAEREQQLLEARLETLRSIQAYRADHGDR